ncbi:nucleoside triphosphate hydrolase [Pelagibacterium xiamenense]|uniref:nucleoside triphosphate hydrolase n=1 Tax=Pelagibacterium xiamenense TaxID=2901140 RepID=UPI001E4D4E53|nr:nucleoside triphosphate hydrolase [Pelagibacterium xiamenense]MCD7060188.1 nucleoside triphosphate hydrolase [Pelagibacterium xiamenense]
MGKDQIASLVDSLLARPTGPRTLVALAGPPGVGKSTLVEQLRDALNAQTPGVAQIVPMDGFHLDNAVLAEKGLMPRKGAPETFDRAGLFHLLTRLRSDTEDDVFIPVFDREMELSRAAGASVPSTCRIVLVEGNYLLLDRPGWRDLHDLFDVKVLIRTDELTLQHRLVRRWKGYGLTTEAISAKVEGNDLPNARLVLNESVKADVELDN